MNVQIKLEGPQGSGKSQLLDLIKLFILEKGFTIMRIDDDDHCFTIKNPLVLLRK